MKVIVLGADGFLGFPLVLKLLARGHEVIGVDNLSRRNRVREIGCHSAVPLPDPHIRVATLREEYPDYQFRYMDLRHGDYVDYLFKKHAPDAVVHLAEIPSAPYSMRSKEHATETYTNNTVGTLNLLFAMRDYAPDCKMVKLGTLGEYGTPKDGFVPEAAPSEFPRSPGSFYHSSKVADSVNCEFASKIWGLGITDIHQGVVYGIITEDMMRPCDCVDKEVDDRLVTRFDFDECFIPDTEIVCNPETKHIQQVKVGDRVLTHKGRYRRVSKLFERDYDGNVIKLKIASKSNPVTCTPNHPFLVVERKGFRMEYTEPKWMSAREIKNWFDEIKFYEEHVEEWFNKAWELRKEHGYGSHRIASILGLSPTLVDSWIGHNHNFRKTIKLRDRLYLIYKTIDETKDQPLIDCAKYNVWEKNKYNPNRSLINPLPDKLELTHDLMRFFGLYLAEGSSNKYNTSLALDPKKDKEVIVFIKKFSIDKLGLKVKIYDRKGVLYIHSKALASLLTDLFGKYAHGKRIPTWMLKLPTSKQKGLLTGIFEGDGHKGNDLELVNKQLCESVRLMLGRMGLHASIYQKTQFNIKLPENRTKDKCTTYKCHYNSTGVKANFKQVDGRILVPIRSAKETNYAGKVYNLHVEEDNTYVAETIAVHNCFGTAVNRFTAQAVIGHKLTPYGKGGQTRGYIALRDSMQCLTIALENPPEQGEFRTFNQIDECYTVMELAEKVKKVGDGLGLDVEIWDHIENPRIEEETHEYEPVSQKLRDLGFKPTLSIEEEMEVTMNRLMRYRSRIEEKREHIMPETWWDPRKKET